MRNFSKKTPYWYLHLNGFFPINNFSFRHNNGKLSTADSDILAIRFPHVQINVAGQEIPWDVCEFEKWGYSYESLSACMLVEIMTSNLPGKMENDINDAFSFERMSFAIKRSGIFPSHQVSQVVSELENKSSVIKSDYYIGKLLITARRPDKTEITPCHILTLSGIDEFISKCYAQCALAIGSGYVEFADELMQYITWRNKNFLN